MCILPFWQRRCIMMTTAMTSVVVGGSGRPRRRCCCCCPLPGIFAPHALRQMLMRPHLIINQLCSLKLFPPPTTSANLPRSFSAASCCARLYNVRPPPSPPLRAVGHTPHARASNPYRRHLTTPSFLRTFTCARDRPRPRRASLHCVRFLSHALAHV